MRRLRVMPPAAVGAALLGAALLGAALLLPWVHYGDFEFRLYDIPGWPRYLTLALAQEAAAVAALLAPTRRRRTVALAVTVALGAAAFAAAVVTMGGGQDSRNMFGPIVPAIFPTLGRGSHAAVLAAIAGVATAVIAWIHRTAPREPAMPARTPS